MNKSILNLILIALLFFYSKVLYSQKYDFKTYKSEDGLVHNQTIDVLQASNGRLWIATIGGVSSFNGLQFENYTIDNGLPHNVSYDVFEDSKARIWIATYKGYAIIENEKVIISNTKLGVVSGFVENDKGEVFITSSTGIHKAHIDSPLETEIFLKKTPLLRRPYLKDQHYLYATTTVNGIYKINIDTKEIEGINNESHGINNIQYFITEDHQGTIWSGGYGEILKISANEKVEIIKFKEDDFNKNRVHSIYPRKNGELLIGFEGNGFAIYNTKTEETRYFNRTHGFNSSFVYGITEDREQNVWLCTLDAGLVRYRDSSFQLFTDKNGLPSNSLSNVQEFNNCLYVGTDKGLVRLKNWKVDKTVILDEPINQIQSFKDSSLLVATHNRVKKLDSNHKLELYHKDLQQELYHDKKNTILYNGSKLTIINKDSTYTLPSVRFLDIFPFGNDYLIPYQDYAVILKGDKKTYIRNSKSKVSYGFRTCAAINNNEVLLANEKKLFHIKNIKDSFKINTYSLKKLGQIQNLIGLAIKKNELWLAGDGVLKKVNLKSLLENDQVIYKDYKINKSFFSDAFIENALYITSDNKIVAPSYQGLFVFDPDKYVDVNVEPKLTFKKISLFSTEVVDSTYRKHKSTKFSADENYLTFNMEAITFTYPENVKYSYRLKGLRDGDAWSEPTKNNKFVFSYLPPGSYTFECIASNGNGMWLKKPVSYVFNIDQPFWKSLSFWVISILSISGILFVIMLYKNKLERRRLIVFSQELITAQENERIRVARELHDGVSQQLMMITRKSKDIGDHLLEILSKDTLNNLRNISHNLHPAVLEQLGFRGALDELVTQLNDQESVQFSFKSKTDQEFNTDQTLHMYRIVQEACQNILKHAQATKGIIEIEKVSNQLLLKITDNGKGFPALNDLKSIKSLGMKSLQERCNIIGAELKITSKPNKGTVITVVLN